MDDFLHYLVRTTVADINNIDINGDPRTWPASWGTLTVAADHSAHATLADDIWTQEGFMLATLDDVATKSSIVWELKPTLNPVAATIAWVFDTEYPYGVDRTSGTGAVFIEDKWGVLPTGSSYVDWGDYANSMQGDLGWYAYTDAAAVAARGRFEGIGWGDNDVELDLLMQQAALKVGQKETLSLTPVTVQMQWMSKWEVGDLVRHANARLGLAEENARINAVHFTFTRNNPVMALEIQWGERQPSLISKTGIGGTGVGSGGGSAYDPGYGGSGGGGCWWTYDPALNALHPTYMTAYVGIGTDIVTDQLTLVSYRDDSPALMSAFHDELDFTGVPTTVNAHALTVYDQAAAGTVTTIHGQYTSIHMTNAGDATEVKNYATWGTIEAAGGVGTWYHMHITGPAITGGGTITTQCGIRIEELTQAGDNWAIYTDGATPSYFGGIIYVPEIQANDALLNITGLAGTAGNDGGEITIAGGIGDTDGNGGDMNFFGGAAAGDGIGGSFSAYGGDSAGVDGRGGGIDIYSGAGNGGEAGSIDIDTGNAGGGAEGSIRIGENNAAFVTIGHAGCDTNIGGELVVIGTILADGDNGGRANTIGITDTSDLTGNSTGVGTTLFKGATSRNSSGFVKIYIGVTDYYIPVFSAITG